MLPLPATARRTVVPFVALFNAFCLSSFYAYQLTFGDILTLVRLEPDNVTLMGQLAFVAFGVTAVLSSYLYEITYLKRWRDHISLVMGVALYITKGVLFVYVLHNNETSRSLSKSTSLLILNLASIVYGMACTVTMNNLILVAHMTLFDQPQKMKVIMTSIISSIGLGALVFGVLYWEGLSGWKVSSIFIFFTSIETVGSASRVLFLPFMYKSTKKEASPVPYEDVSTPDNDIPQPQTLEAQTSVEVGTPIKAAGMDSKSNDASTKGNWSSIFKAEGFTLTQLRVLVTDPLTVVSFIATLLGFMVVTEYLNTMALTYIAIPGVSSSDQYFVMNIVYLSFHLVGRLLNTGLFHFFPKVRFEAFLYIFWFSACIFGSALLVAKLNLTTMYVATAFVSASYGGFWGTFSIIATTRLPNPRTNSSMNLSIMVLSMSIASLAGYYSGKPLLPSLLCKGTSCYSDLYTLLLIVSIVGLVLALVLFKLMTRQAPIMG